VKQMVADFHRRNVRVLFPMMMWDQGTNSGVSWPDAIASVMAEIGADGINGDTQDGVPLASPALPTRPVIPSPSNRRADPRTRHWRGTHDVGTVPVSVRTHAGQDKWLETRHMVNISDRWKREKTDTCSLLSSMA